MSVLSDILSKVKVNSVVYFKSDFSEPWGMEIPKGEFAQFHIVTKGQCILKTNGKLIKLFTGDIVVFPLGSGHWIADNEMSKRHKGEEVLESILSGNSIFEGNMLSTTLVCGHFEFDRRLDHPFIKELPSIIHINDTDLRQFSWLKNITDLIIEETDNERAGSSIILNKLGEILFVHTLRAYIEKNESINGFIAAIRDTRISKVLKEIHASPKYDWKIEELAKVAAMSRTSFSNRFKALTGDTGAFRRNKFICWRNSRRSWIPV